MKYILATDHVVESTEDRITAISNPNNVGKYRLLVGDAKCLMYTRIFSTMNDAVTFAKFFWEMFDKYGPRRWAEAVAERVEDEALPMAA